MAGALTPMTPAAATQLPPSYGVITPAGAAAWGAQMAAQAQAAAAAARHRRRRPPPPRRRRHMAVGPQKASW